MELVKNTNPKEMIYKATEITQTSNSSFIEANTQKVTLDHLKNDCIIPVFSKDNETTISHFQFINTVFEFVKSEYKHSKFNAPDIRVSHQIKGRVPSAIGKPVKELLESERTIYYERCAFVIEIPEVTQVINGNRLALTIGGVRSLAQENLYSKKSLEKFKIFIGYQNKVCLNLCISTDGLSDSIRIASITELEQNIDALMGTYNVDMHLDQLAQMEQHSLSEEQFAHFIGKARMYQHLDKNEIMPDMPFMMNDSQINQVVKGYYRDGNFGRDTDGSINLWNLYNLMTDANKSSYIDFNLERNVNAFELITTLGNSIKNDQMNWFLN